MAAIGARPRLAGHGVGVAPGPAAGLARTVNEAADYVLIAEIVELPALAAPATQLVQRLADDLGGEVWHQGVLRRRARPLIAKASKGR